MKGGVFAYVINAFQIDNVPGTRLIICLLFLLSESCTHKLAQVQQSGGYSGFTWHAPSASSLYRVASRAPQAPCQLQRHALAVGDAMTKWGTKWQRAGGGGRGCPRSIMRLRPRTAAPWHPYLCLRFLLPRCAALTPPHPQTNLRRPRAAHAPICRTTLRKGLGDARRGVDE